MRRMKAAKGHAPMALPMQFLSSHGKPGFLPWHTPALRCTLLEAVRLVRRIGFGCARVNPRAANGGLSAIESGHIV